MIFEKLLSILYINNERELYPNIYDTIVNGIAFRGTNLWILIFAIFIASVGLNVNSTAVIIGAMLVSPLMGPIIGLGFSAATYDMPLLRRSAMNFLFAIIGSITTSTIYFALSPLNDAHSELLARTTPTIYDVVIAFFGGLAGIFAIVSRKKGNVLPGVAIATALMPPLCTAGYGIATAQWNFFLGAIYLFTINTVFIGLSTMLVTRLMKLPMHDATNETLRVRANRWVTLIVVVTIVPSVYFGYVLIRQDRFQKQSSAFIANECEIEGNILLQSKSDPKSKTITLVFGGKGISDSLMRQLQNKRMQYDLADAEIIVKQGFAFAERSSMTDRSKIDAEKLHLKTVNDSLEQTVTLKQSIETEIIALEPSVVHLDLTRTGDSATVYLIPDKPVNEDKLNDLRKWLMIRLKVSSLKLTVSYVMPRRN